ncbi:MAG: hypothetical protein AB1714_21425 [Acidobacteriota bacterium]
MPAETPKDVTIRECIQILEDYLNSLPEDMKKKPPHKQAGKALNRLTSLIDITARQAQELIKRTCDPRPVIG